MNTIEVTEKYIKELEWSIGEKNPDYKNIVLTIKVMKKIAILKIYPSFESSIFIQQFKDYISDFNKEILWVYIVHKWMKAINI